MIDDLKSILDWFRGGLVTVGNIVLFSLIYLIKMTNEFIAYKVYG